MSTDPKNIFQAKDPQAEFCSAFLRKAMRKYKKKTEDFSLTVPQKMFLGSSQAVASGSLFFLDCGALSTAVVPVHVAGEKMMKGWNKVKAKKIEREARCKIDPTSSADLQLKFYRMLLEDAVNFYHVYEYQLQNIYIENTFSLDHVGGLHKIGEFVGGRALDKFKKGKVVNDGFSENAVSGFWSKFKDFVKKEKLIFKVSANEYKNLSECEFFNKSLPLFYQETKDKVQETVWMRNEDWDLFETMYGKEVNYLRRPTPAELECFKNKDFGMTKLKNPGGWISKYKYEPATPEFIDNLLEKLENHYLGEDGRMSGKLKQNEADVELILEIFHGTKRAVVTRFNNSGTDMEKLEACAHFIKPGKSTELERAIKMADENKSATTIQEKMVLIHGMAGVGKSSLARWCAGQDRDKNVWWINSGTAQSILQSFFELARHLDIINEKQGQEIIPDWLDEEYGQKLVRQVFAHIFKHKIKNVLLIYDNPSEKQWNSLGIIQNYLPQISTTQDNLKNQHYNPEFLPVILVTTEYESVCSWSKWELSSDQKVELVSWTEDETLSFLEKRFDFLSHSSSEEKEEENEKEKYMKKMLRRIFERFGGFPLATAIVASNIATEFKNCSQGGKDGNSRSMAVDTVLKFQKLDSITKSWCEEMEMELVMDFKKLMRKSFKKFMGKTDHVAVLPNRLAVVLNRIISGLEKNNDQDQNGTQDQKLALHLLQMMAFIPNDEISLAQLYFTLNPQRLTPQIKNNYQTNSNYSRMRRALDILQEYNLVEIVNDQTSINTHRGGNRESRRIYTFFQSEGHPKVRTHRIVQKWTRDNLDKGSPKIAEILSQVMEFYVQYHGSYFSSTAGQVLKDLAEFEWPGETYKQCLILVTAKFPEFPEFPEYLKSLKKVLVKRKNYEYSNLCDLALLLCELDTDGINKKIDSATRNSTGDINYKVKNDPEKLTWVLSQLEKHWENHSFFNIGCLCLDSFDQSAFTKEAQEKTFVTWFLHEAQDKTFSWLTCYFNKISKSPTLLPPLANLFRIIQVLDKAEIEITDQVGFVIQAAQALNGLNDTIIASFPAHVTTNDIWDDFLWMFLWNIEDFSASELGLATLAKDGNVFKLLSAIFSTAVTCYKHSNSNTWELDMFRLLTVLCKLATDKHFAVTALSSTQFMQTFQWFLELDFYGNERGVLWTMTDFVNGTEFEPFLLGLLLGFSIFSHGHRPQVQKTFLNFVDAVEKYYQVLRVLLLGAQEEEKFISSVISTFNLYPPSSSGMEIEALENFAAIYKNNKTAKAVIHFAEFFKSILEEKLENPLSYRGFVFCDGCENDQVLTGVYFHCDSCDDFDFCEMCKQTREHVHNDWDRIVPFSVSTLRRHLLEVSDLQFGNSKFYA